MPATSFLSAAKTEKLQHAFVLLHPNDNCCGGPLGECYENNGCYELPLLRGGLGTQTFARLLGYPAVPGVFPLQMVNCDTNTVVASSFGTATVTFDYPFLVWLDIPPIPLLPPGRYVFRVTIGTETFCTTVFRYACRPCYATFCQWFACGNDMGYPYSLFAPPPFFQSLALPLWFHSPFLFEESKVDTDSNGFTRRRYARVQKKWQMDTAPLPPFALEALQLAISHGVFIAQVNEYPLPSWRGLTAESALEIDTADQNPPPFYRPAKATFIESRYSKFATFCDPCLEGPR